MFLLCLQQAIASRYTHDERYPGIRFFETPKVRQVSSSGAHITSWRKEHGVEFYIPPGAIPPGNIVDISVWPCSNGPFILPDQFEFASPVVLISPPFHFSREITLTMSHFSKLVTVDDCKEMVFLSAPSSSEIAESPAYRFKILKHGDFKPNQKFGNINLTHFCLVGVGREKRSKCNRVYSASYYI